MKQASSLLLFIIPVFLANCHKHNTGSEHHGNDSAVVFTNAADPRLAQLFTDTSIITFFGSRDQNGRPQSLTGYQVEHGSAHNSDFVAIDNDGRYSSIILSTGEQIHFRYIGDDSLNIIMSDNDTSFQQNISLGGNNAHNPFYKEAKHFPVEPNGEHVVVVTGIDKNVNIKVTAKNTIDNSEENVAGDEAVVRVRLMANGGRDYTLTVPYKGGGIYSIPISASGIEFGDDPIRQTIDLIIDKLNTACAKPKSADPTVDKSVPAIIAAFVCPLPHPVAKAICL
ncbi:MAG TPA: hypothetical protein VHC48_20460, partial [Puia sp.]|nr:hypothetical protein [Puia sp.]